VRFSEAAPATSAFFRTLYALPILYFGWLFVRRKDGRSRQRRGVALAAGAMLGIDLAVWHRAIEDIGAGPATVLGNTQVVLVGLVAWLVLRERPSRLSLLILPLVLVGVALVGGIGSADAYGTAPGRGAVWGLATGVAYAGFVLAMRFASADRGSPVGPLADATLGAALTTLLLGLPDTTFDLVPSWPMHGWLLALALGSQVFGWLLITHALPRLPALETSVLLLLQPTATLVWGRLLFDERLSTGQTLGAILVLAGVTSVSLASALRRRPAGVSSPAK
jgi:drug/metabolite transporter (DMT)-like permease